MIIYNLLMERTVFSSFGKILIVYENINSYISVSVKNKSKSIKYALFHVYISMTKS
jgi:hypothetical protein